jgi:hypothetical protein
MKKIIMIGLISLISQFSFAGYCEKIQYWYSQNISTNVPDIREIVVLRDDSDGQGIHFLWQILNPPSKETIDAIDDATAIAWAEDKRQDKIADYEKWTDRERKMLKLLVKENNSLRAWCDNLKLAIATSATLAEIKTKVAALPDMPVRTKEQIIAALKAKE